MSNDELLDELVYSYEDMRAYVLRDDWVKWSEEAEEKAMKKYSDLRDEVLKRMVD